MPVARLFTVRAHHGREEDVKAETRRLLEHFTDQPGFIHGYMLEFPSMPAIVVRFTVWESRDHADHVANTEHSMAVISHIRSMADETTAPEGVYEAVEFSGPGHRS